MCTCNVYLLVILRHFFFSITFLPPPPNFNRLKLLKSLNTNILKRISNLILKYAIFPVTVKLIFKSAVQLLLHCIYILRTIYFYLIFYLFFNSPEWNFNEIQFIRQGSRKQSLISKILIFRTFQCVQCF